MPCYVLYVCPCLSFEPQFDNRMLAEVVEKENFRERERERERESLREERRARGSRQA